MELEVTQAYEVALFGVLYIFRFLRTFNYLRKRSVRVVPNRGEVQDFLPGSIREDDGEVGFRVFLVYADGRPVWLVRGYVEYVLLGEFLPAAEERETQVMTRLGGVHREESPARLLQRHIRCREAVAGLHSLHITDSIPVLAELLRLIRGAPVVVRLVVRVCSGHKFDVVTRVVGEDACVPLAVRTPKPELAALADVVVGVQHRARVPPVVIAGDEVVLQVVGEHGVAHVVVLPPAGVDAVPVEIHVVEGLVRNRPVGEPVLAVEGHELSALRKADLIVLIHVGADVRPVEHGVVVLGGVHQTAADFHIALARMKGHSYCPLHPVSVLCFSHPDSLRPVGVLHYPPVARNMARLTVMVEDVPLHAAAYPRSGHSDVRRLHNVVVVEDVVAVGLVHRVQKPAAELRHYAQLHVLILHVQAVVGHVLLRAGHVVVQWIWIDASLRPLVGPVTLEDRRLLRRVKKVGRHRYLALPGFDWGGRHRRCRIFSLSRRAVNGILTVCRVLGIHSRCHKQSQS